MWGSEEKITIGESGHDPREQTGGAGARFGETPTRSPDPAKNLLGLESRFKT
jgi:hypothetical protein